MGDNETDMTQKVREQIAELLQRSVYRDGAGHLCEKAADTLQSLLDERENRDRDWVLAIGHALGLESGFMVPIAPEVEPFKELFAAVRSELQAENERLREQYAEAREEVTTFSSLADEYAEELRDICDGLSAKTVIQTQRASIEKLEAVKEAAKIVCDNGTANENYTCAVVSLDFMAELEEALAAIEPSPDQPDTDSTEP